MDYGYRYAVIIKSAQYRSDDVTTGHSPQRLNDMTRQYIHKEVAEVRGGWINTAPNLCFPPLPLCAIIKKLYVLCDLVCVTVHGLSACQTHNEPDDE